MARIPRYVGRMPDGKQIEMDPELTRLLNELFNGKSSASVGSILSGVTQAQAAAAAADAKAEAADGKADTANTNIGKIGDGTFPVSDVLISGRGSLNAAQDAQDGNTQSAASAASTAGGGSLTATISPTSLSGTRTGAGSVTTGDGPYGSAATCTVTPSGGTGPYTYAWTKVSGDTLTLNAPTSATTSFSASVNLGQFLSATYRCTVTDSTGGTPQTFAVTVSVTLAEVGSVL